MTVTVTGTRHLDDSLTHISTKPFIIHQKAAARTIQAIQHSLYNRPRVRKTMRYFIVEKAGYRN